MFSSGVPKIRLSKNFHETCVKIGECKSREEEEAIVSKWMQEVKATLNKSKISISDLYENVISLIHLTLLGYNTRFGQIHAVNLTQDSQMMTKALGYLACSALFDSKSDLIVLIVNSTQRDLSSGQTTSMALALTAIAHLVTPELIQPIIGFISQCLNHSVPLIRQKAIMCVHSFIRKDPSCVVEFFPDLCRLLNDPDLSIMNAVVNTFSTLLKNTLNIRQICEVLPDIARMTQLIQTGNVRVEYTHQRVNAPFVLVNIYSLFRRMAPHMPEMAETVEPFLTQSLQVGTLESSASASVLYEAIKCCISLGLTSIPQLRGAISLFMGSKEQNYKFIGLGLLAEFPDFADEFQGIVIDCLEHPDPSIRLRTLGLLHSMANENNAQIIVINMLRFFQRTKNESNRRELADRITQISAKYAPSPLWFAKTMEQLFAIGGDLVRPEVAFAVMRIIEEECDEELRKSIVNLYLDIVQSGRHLSDVFVTVIAKVIGKYAELSDEYELDFIALMLCDLADGYENPRDWVLQALLQITPRLNEIPAAVINVFQNYQHSRQIIVQEICYEALSLINYKESLAQMIEPEEEYDLQLTFLDDFVEDAIVNKGAKEYIPIEDRDGDLLISNKSTLIYTAYPTDSPGVYGNDGASPAPRVEEEPAGLNTAGVRMVWGDAGLIEVEDEPTVNPVQSLNVAEPSTPVAEPGKKPSMFAKMSVNAKKKDNPADEKKEKIANSLFGKKPTKKQSEEPAPPSPVTQPKAISKPQPAKVGISPEDSALLEKTKELCSAPQPESMSAFISSGNPVPVFASGPIKVAALAQNGTILVAVMNDSETPIIKFSIKISGPESLLSEIQSHPNEINCLPPRCQIFQMIQYKFPTQLSGFPEMRFNCTVNVNGQINNFQLPMSLLTFIAPTSVSTPDFGKLWKAGGNELIYSIQRTPEITIDSISEMMNTAVHVKTVQRIGQEEIFIGNLVSTPFKVLIHVKFAAQKIDIKILTKAGPLTQAILKEIRSQFE